MLLGFALLQQTNCYNKYSSATDADEYRTAPQLKNMPWWGKIYI